MRSGPSDVADVLSELASHRAVFHSEADFQFALAWQWQQRAQEAKIRLEYPLPSEDRRTYADLWIQEAGITSYLELKYWKRGLRVISSGERFNLVDQGAHDISRYDFLRDLKRVERMVRSGHANRGAVVALTNDPLYWTAGTGDTVDADFRLHDGRLLSGELAWGPDAGTGMTKGREQSLRFVGAYRCHWLPYSQLPGQYGEFRYLCLAVE